ncbi:MAG: sigma-70 family RNA polymerase sigma factor [Ignavibacteriaceae bacterium]
MTTISIPNNLTQKEHISAIVKNYGNRLKGFIRKRVNSIEDAEDILQDVFYQLAEADLLMKPVEQVSAWLYTVARNRITDLYRKKKTEAMSDFLYDDGDDDAVTELSELLYDTGSTPETQYLQTLIWDEIEKALSELPEEQRIVFELNELKGISFNEIAELTGQTVNTLISRKRYAVLHLRKRLKTLYNELKNF